MAEKKEPKGKGPERSQPTIGCPMGDAQNPTPVPAVFTAKGTYSISREKEGPLLTITLTVTYPDQSSMKFACQKQFPNWTCAIDLNSKLPNQNDLLVLDLVLSDGINPPQGAAAARTVQFNAASADPCAQAKRR